MGMHGTFWISPSPWKSACYFLQYYAVRTHLRPPALLWIYPNQICLMDTGQNQDITLNVLIYKDLLFTLIQRSPEFRTVAPDDVELLGGKLLW